MLRRTTQPRGSPIGIAHVEADDNDEAMAVHDDEGDGEYDEGDGEQDDFVPPSASTALRRSWMSSRARAQPATGTEEDARKVNLVDRRERMLGYFLGVMLAALAVASYFVDRHYVDKKNLKLAAQIHSEAPWILLVTLGLAAMIIAATYFKRRAAVGFTLLLAGVALFNSDFLIGIIYLGAGLWLIFRSMKRSPRAAAGARGGAAARPNASARSRSRDGTGTASSASLAAPESSGTKAPSGRMIGRNGRLANSSPAGPTGRYTPPKPVRHAPPAVPGGPGSSNRLSAWLKK